MKVLIIGNGGREHAIAWKFAQSKSLSGLFVLPGNGGTSNFAQNIDSITMHDHSAIIALAKEKHISLVFVGPEVPLSEGLVDSLQKAGIPAIGPHQQAAQLESSKAFSKAFLLRNQLPTASAVTFSDADAFTKYIDNSNGMLVVKKSGLAAGKGVLESDNHQTLKEFGLQYIGTDQIVVEEFLKGYEVSIFTISDGKTYKILPPATDYKKAHDNNQGPNTGGMGAISPVPWLDRETMHSIEQKVIEPVFAALKKENLMYKGILYFGLMITAQGPKILEFNVRFGDPEAQVVIPKIQNDFCSLFNALANGTLDQVQLHIDERVALGVVLAAPGYPGDYPKHIGVTSQFTNHDPQRILFHAGTQRQASKVETTGGRCFTCVGLGKDIEQARHFAYSLCNEVNYEGKWHRNDIGKNMYEKS